MNSVLQRALEANQPVQVIYLDASNRITQRKVLPQEMKGKMLRAHCFLRNQTRHFNTDNILSVFPVQNKLWQKSG
jgi:predicted DNA-binding transcriptional regulator YafY